MITLHVTDMTCDGCVRAITKAVQRVDAGASVTADVAAKRVAVESKAAADALAAAVREAGFDARPA